MQKEKGDLGRYIGHFVLSLYFGKSSVQAMSRSAYIIDSVLALQTDLLNMQICTVHGHGPSS